VDHFDDEIENLIQRVIGCAIQVHRALGPGYAESVYGNALELVFRRESIPYVREYRFRVMFEGSDVGEGRIDFLIGNRLVVEIKAKRGIADVDIAQTVGYLTHRAEPVGLLLNFHVALMKNGIKRVVRAETL